MIAAMCVALAAVVLGALLNCGPPRSARSSSPQLDTNLAPSPGAAALPREPFTISAEDYERIASSHWLSGILIRPLGAAPWKIIPARTAEQKRAEWQRRTDRLRQRAREGSLR